MSQSLVPIAALIVEDSPNDGHLVFRTLEQAGYEVTWEQVASADELRQRLSARPWDLVLSDHRMPDFSGPEALRIVRAHDEHLPFILVSGAIGEDRAVAIIKEGANDFVSKARLQDLDRAVERALSETRSRRAERHAEALYRGIAELSPDGILVVDRGGRVLRANRQVAAVLRVESPQVLAGVLVFRFIDERDELLARGLLTKALQTGERVQQTLRARSAEGHEMVTEVRAVRTREPGDAQSVILSIRDVTEHQRLEESFRHAQKMEAIGRLAGGVAHDFNNIVNVILAFADFMREDLPDDHACQDHVLEILAATERASGLTRQLLAFGRRGPVRPRVISINKPLLEMKGMLRRVLGEDVQVNVRLSPDIWPVRIDVGHLEQVITNLAVNARDAMSTGDEFILETRNMRLRAGDATSLPGAEPGDYVLLLASDSGHGIPWDIQEFIFEPFFTTKDDGKGSGLGLSTVYAIVEQAGGSIHLSSEPGLGTTFTVALPRHEGQALDPPEPRLSTGERATFKGLRALLVEDEDALRRATRRTLERIGFEVAEAANGRAALELVQEHEATFDVVLTDVVMPVMSGKALADELLEQAPTQRVVFMSGYPRDTIASHGVLDEDVILVQKPFTTKDLVEKLRQAFALSP